MTVKTFAMLQNIAQINAVYLFSHLADAFVQSDLQMRTIEAIKTNKRATTCKCYSKKKSVYLYLLVVHQKKPEKKKNSIADSIKQFH